MEVADINTNLASQLRDEELKLTSFRNVKAPGVEHQECFYELTFNFFQSLPVQFDNTVLIGTTVFRYSKWNYGRHPCD
ncbi:MAG: hypothetical protein IPF54_24370 [Draconibacterium sp.]|nr:hypothetical protein [Draconibacterium sp.]